MTKLTIPKLLILQCLLRFGTLTRYKIEAQVREDGGKFITLPPHIGATLDLLSRDGLISSRPEANERDEIVTVWFLTHDGLYEATGQRAALLSLLGDSK